MDECPEEKKSNLIFAELITVTFLSRFVLTVAIDYFFHSQGLPGTESQPPTHTADTLQGSATAHYQVPRYLRTFFGHIKLRAECWERR